MLENSRPITDSFRLAGRARAKCRLIGDLLRVDILSAAAIIDGLPDEVMAVDMDGTVRYVNGAFEKLLGYKAEELLGTAALNLPTYRRQENLEKGALPSPLTCMPLHKMDCVEDNGIGIAPEYQTKVFEIFQRLDPDFSTGEGLGLSIAKRIIGQHNGNIWVESEKDVGSKFFISLPAVE